MTETHLTRLTALHVKIKAGVFYKLPPMRFFPDFQFLFHRSHFFTLVSSYQKN